MSNTAATPQGRVTNIHERVNAQSARANQPMACTCGSTHFYVVRTEEFADNGYGTAQLRSLSMNQEPLYVCICGRPVPLKDSSVGKGSEGARARFLRSLQLAIEDQKKRQPQGLAQGFVSIAEHEEAKATIEELQGKVDWLMSAVETLNEAAEETEEETEGAGDTSEVKETATTATAAPAQPRGKGRGGRQAS